MKECKKCKRELPANTDFYFKKCDTKDGFMNRCKECQGSAFSNHLTKILPKEGFKFCIKCDRELQIDIRFFSPDKMCKKDGLRNVCRECTSDRHFMKEGYVPKEWWTVDEELLFVNTYPHYTNEELIDKFFPNENSKSLTDKAFKMGKINKTYETSRRADRQQGLKISGENSPYYGKPKSDETRRKISNSRKGKYLGVNNYWFGKKRSEKQRIQIGNRVKLAGRWKGNNNPRHLNPLIGELNGRWEGGLTSENHKIRNSDEYRDWRLAVFIRDGFTCQCCGTLRGNLEAHHIENFSSNAELRFDINNGITMCKECHNPTEYNSFHYIYGTRNNTKNQLEEYISRFKTGEFKVEEVS